jgi:SAM-dependent methyltransferase
MTDDDSRLRDVPNFDRIARVYRWLEYFSFGPLLERCRFAQLSKLRNAKHALVLGDGDGRFLARLMGHNCHLIADVVDASATMTALSRARVEALGSAGRVYFHHTDARDFLPAENCRYDLVVTHFFLDCLSEDEIAELSCRLRRHLAPRALWIVSEFAIPDERPVRLLARLLIRTLYLAFGWLTGLRTQRLPDYHSVLRNSGFTCENAEQFCGGILRSELWRS